jgi:hypothetical protein
MRDKRLGCYKSKESKEMHHDPKELLRITKQNKQRTKPRFDKPQKLPARQRHGFMVDSATNMVVSTSCDNKWVTSRAIAMVRKNMRVIEKHQLWL